jgi:hypothetical protein
MRVLITLGALLLGLVGLFMSLCGGGLLLGGIIDAVRTRSSNLTSILLITIPFTLMGIGIIVASVKILQNQSKKDPG